MSWKPVTGLLLLEVSGGQLCQWSRNDRWYQQGTGSWKRITPRCAEKEKTWNSSALFIKIFTATVWKPRCADERLSATNFIRQLEARWSNLILFDLLFFVVFFFFRFMVIKTSLCIVCRVVLLCLLCIHSNISSRYQSKTSATQTQNKPFNHDQTPKYEQYYMYLWGNDL